jgi:hypothetical protein
MPLAPRTRVFRRREVQYRYRMSDVLPQSDAPLSPLDAFEQTLADAERMLRIASGLADVRVKRMRADFKRKLGAALGVPSDQRALLERAEGHDAWVILKPHARLSRAMFGQEALSPLVRQSVVVIGAAVESYVADRACAAIREMLYGGTLPEAATARLTEDIRLEASADPKKISSVFKRLGVEQVLPEACEEAGFKVNKVLADLVVLRNRIAHGRDAEALSPSNVLDLLERTRSVVRALEEVLTRRLGPWVG